MSLETITALSVKYGSDPAYVLAGGGNTSVKDEKYLYVKPSGVALAKIKPENFVKMDDMPSDVAQREAIAKEFMMAAVCPESSGRPSVEAPLHELIPFRYVVHLHPALVNGMTCAENGAKACAELFPDALWIAYVDPGYTLSRKVADEMAAYKKARGTDPKVIFLQNHGVFAGADTDTEINAIYDNIMSTLKAAYAKAGIAVELKRSEPDFEASKLIAPKLRTILAYASTSSFFGSSDTIGKDFAYTM